MARHGEIYNTTEWKRVRKQVIIRAYGLCERCKEKGIVKKGNEVHHKQELTDFNKHDWNIAYNTKNLILLCSDCHNDEHDRSTGLQNFLNPPGDPK